MISLRSSPFTLLIKLDPGRWRRLALPQYAAALRRPAARSVRAAAVAESVGAELRRLARDRVSANDDDDDRLLNYETLLVDRFLDILQDLHGSNFRRVVEGCLRVSGEYQRDAGDQEARLGQLGALFTSLDVGDAITLSSSFSHMLNLANLVEEIQMVYQKKMEASRGGGFADEGTAPTESDIDETIQRLVHGLGKTPREVFDALRSQTIDLVFTAHPTQSVRRSLLEKHASIRTCLTQLCVEGISENEKQEIDEALQREILAAFRTDEIRRTPPTPQDEMRAGMSYFHDTIWNGVPKFLRRVDTALKNIGIDERLPYDVPLIQFSSWMGGDRDGNPRVTPEVTRDVCLLARMMAANMYFSKMGSLMFELSMWRCNDELRARADELHRLSSRKYAKYYIEFWKQISPREPYRIILGDIRDKLYNTCERAREILSHGVSSIAEEDTYRSVDEFLEPLELCYRSLCDCGDKLIADGSLLDFMRQVATFGLCLLKLDIRQESDRHTEAMDAITTHLGMGSSKLRADAFRPLIAKIDKYLSGWQALLLSSGGRVVLLNAVLDAIPIYAMCAMPLPPQIIKAIDALRRAFLWNAAQKASGAKCLVAWINVCRSKDEGGLGVRSLALQNDCLQVKLLHRLFSRPDLPWSSWVWRTLGGPICERRCAALVGPHWKHLCSLLPLYRSITAVDVGDGQITAFWRDRWVGEEALCHAMPALFSHAVAPDAAVCQVLAAGLDASLVPRLTTAATRERDALRVLLASITVNPGVSDSRRLLQCRGAKGSFSASALYKLCHFGGVAAPFADFVWENQAPSKVQFFGWLLALDRLPTRSSLLRKNILSVEEAACPICQQPLETGDHLFFGCSFARRFWAAVGGAPPPDASVRLFYEYPAPAGVPAPTACSCSLLCYWQLWKHRNGVVFQGLRPCLPLLLKNCRDDALLWRARLPPELQHETQAWLRCFSPATT